MKEKYMFWCERAEHISDIFAPALLWHNKDCDIIFGIMLINKKHFTEMVKFVNHRRAPLKIQPVIGDEIREFLDIGRIGEDNTSMLMSVSMQVRFMVKDRIWKEGFSVCRLCTKLLDRMKFKCLFETKHCVPEWKI